jgi:hypothetical protein
VAPKTNGWFGLSPLTLTEWFGNVRTATTDRDIYLGLLDLELQLANQWAGAGSSDSGASTTNKVTAGFAKAGIFLIPVVCIDRTTTEDPSLCLDGESGADAVIDVDDNDNTDDYLKRGSSPPKFHVWTGPRYVFSKDGMAVFPKTAPCNVHFQVEVANDADFTVNLTRSGFIDVKRESSDPSRHCYDTWQIPNGRGQWDLLAQGNSIYYKATTFDENGKNERTSTAPGNGLFQVPPPYAIVNETGKPLETRQ